LKKRKSNYLFLIIVILILIVIIIAVLLLGNRQKVHNYSIAYIHDSEIVLKSNNELKDESEQIYEAGSLGKVVTSYICMRLVEEHKISLDDKIVGYLDKDMKSNDLRMNEITVRQLLSHTAGFSPNFEVGVDNKIYYKPGSNFCYSGVGYIYLQHVIEKVTGQEFETVAQNYVFNPLNMKNSTYGTGNTVTPFVKTSSLTIYVVVISAVISIVFFILGLIMKFVLKLMYLTINKLFYISIAIGMLFELLLIYLIAPRLILITLLYEIIGIIVLLTSRKSVKYYTYILYVVCVLIFGIIIPVSLPLGPVLVSQKPNAAYTLRTTSYDMALFGNALLKLYKSETDIKREMFNPQIQLDDMNSWGLGIAIENEDTSVTYWHSGINMGMQSLFVLYPEGNQAVIVMTNSDYGLEYAKNIVKEKLGIRGTWDIIRTDLTKIDSGT
jgi:CubicO group peptidase (beta-lactamase class C family)